MTVLLLDTHVLLWAARDDPALTESARAALIAAPERYVSAASGYEIALKTRLGKLPGGERVLDGWSLLIARLQATELSLQTAEMARAGGLTWPNRDPFDRMLVAQAQLRGLTLLTKDPEIRAFTQVSSVWPE